MYKFSINAHGGLELDLVPDQDIKVEEVKVDDQPKVIELAGGKRTRGDLIETDEDSWENEMGTSDDRHYSDIEVQERLLNQMLARRRKTETEESEATKNGTLARNDIYSDRPFLKELMIDIVYKRKRTDE